MAEKYSTEDFIEKAKQIHNNKYNYTLVDYKNCHTKVIIICKKHGNFAQRPSGHLQGYGCKKCQMWSKEDIIEFLETHKFKKIIDLQKFNGSVDQILRDRYPDLVTQYFPNKLKAHTKQDIINFISFNNIQSRVELEKLKPRMYQTALKKFPEILPNRLRKYFIKEELQEIAKKYTNRTKFREENPSAYSSCRYKNCLDEVCSHMVPKASSYLRDIYVYEFEDGYAYVGLTYDLDLRHKQHLRDKKDPVYRHLNICKNYSFKVLEKEITINKAAEREKYWINQYKKTKICLLNASNNGGQLGSTRRHCDKMLENEAKKYSNKRDFLLGSPLEFYTAHNRKILNKICKHMVKLHRLPWSLKELKIEALKYKTKAEFSRGSYGAYLAAYKKGLLNLICSHMDKTLWKTK